MRMLILGTLFAHDAASRFFSNSCNNMMPFTSELSHSHVTSHVVYQHIMVLSLCASFSAYLQRQQVACRLELLLDG